MPIDVALRWIELLVAFAILQRGAEHLRREPGIFAPQMILAVLLLTGMWSGPVLIGVWLTGLMQLWRFRGPYNGGADKMLLLSITCVMVARVWPSVAEVAMAYLGAQLCLSYMVSGWVKIRNPEWRDGTALHEVFSYSVYPSSEGLRDLADRPALFRAASWAVIGFELSFPVALLTVPLLVAALGLAAMFHLANAFLFGLNRFVWAWIAAFPALLWLQARLFL